MAYQACTIITFNFRTEKEFRKGFGKETTEKNIRLFKMSGIMQISVERVWDQHVQRS